MAKLITLSFDASWSDDDQSMLSDKLGLTERQEERLFGQHKTIELTAEQSEALNALNDDADDTEQDEQTEETTEETEQPKQEDANEADIIDVSIASKRDRDAVTLGEKLSKDTNKVFSEGYEARERVNITPLLLRKAFITDEGDEAMSLWPVPGSYLKNSKVMIGTGSKAQEIPYGDNEQLVWDKYTYMDVSETTGKQVKKSGAFYKSFVRSTEVGRKLQKEYDNLSVAIASFKKDGPVCPAVFQKLTRPQCVRRRNLANSRLSYMENATRQAVKLDKQCRAFDDLINVGYRFETETVDKQEQYVNRNEPIQVFSVSWSEGKDKQGKPIRTRSEGEPSNLSIGAFNRYNVLEAIAKAGGKDKVTLEHLQSTVKRDTNKQSDTNKQGSKDDWSKHDIENERQLENIFSSLVSYLTTPDGDVNSKRESGLLKRMGEADGDEVVLLIGDVCNATDRLWTIVEKRYRDLAAKRASTSEQSKAA